MAVLTIRLADPVRDNAALCALARACPQGQRLRFYHERTDHWERCRHFERAEVWVAERGGTIVGAGSLAWKHVWLEGELRLATYFLDRIVHPDYRRQGIGRALLEEELASCADSAVCYGLVLEDNAANRHLLEARGFTPLPWPMLYHAMIPRWVKRQPTPEFHLVEPAAERTAAWLDEALRSDYALMDPSAQCGMGLFVLGARVPRAAGVLYRHGLKVVTHAPWYYSLLASWTGLGARVGEPVRTWILGNLWFEDERALAELLSGVAAAALEEGAPLILIPLAVNDPRRPVIARHTITRWGIAPTRVLLYAYGEGAGLLLTSRRPVLPSPRDG